MTPAPPPMPCPYPLLCAIVDRLGAVRTSERAQGYRAYVARLRQRNADLLT